MPGYAADEEPAGGEAGRPGGQRPPNGFGIGHDGAVGPMERPPEPSPEPVAPSVSGECSVEFDTGYAGPGGRPAVVVSDYSAPSAADGFGWLVLGVDPGADREVGSLDDLGDEASIVRPYAWTRGRTRANYDLKLETLISTTELAADETLLPQLEHRAVSSLCRYPLSVAEVAAKLSIPLGVARVILSDMAELGLISIHRTFAEDDIAAHLVLMERVLSGLRRL